MQATPDCTDCHMQPSLSTSLVRGSVQPTSNVVGFHTWLSACAAHFRPLLRASSIAGSFLTTLFLYIENAYFGVRRPHILPEASRPGGLVEFSELEGSSVMTHPTHLRNVQLSNSNLEKAIRIWIAMTGVRITSTVRRHCTMLSGAWLPRVPMQIFQIF